MSLRVDLQALTFLASLVTAGAASVSPCPAFIAPPVTLRLILTIAVHPSLTTRAKSPDLVQASDLAFRYLRLVLQNVGALQPRFVETLVFPGRSSRGQGTRRRARAESPPRDGTTTHGIDFIQNNLAHSASLFAQADSFWHVVGWAFNCSLLHRERWDRWSMWLDYMIDVLQADWDSRSNQQDSEVTDGLESKADSLIVHYIIAGGAQADNGRRILRAIFADGKGTALGEFPEIWRNETKKLKASKEGETDANIVKRDEGIDMEADDYGDYISDENDYGDLDDTDHDDDNKHQAYAKTSFSSSPAHLVRPPAAPLGGSQALNLRYRLLALLDIVCNAHPHAFVSSLFVPRRSRSRQERSEALPQGETTATLYTMILSHMRSFSLPTFHLLFSPSTLVAAFCPDTASVLTQVLLHRCNLIEVKAPEPDSYRLDQDSLVASYLPWGANAAGGDGEDTERPNKAGRGARGSASNERSFVNEAKVSICTETLLRLLHYHGGGLDWNLQLQDAAEQGIKRRERGGPPPPQIKTGRETSQKAAGGKRGGRRRGGRGGRGGRKSGNTSRSGVSTGEDVLEGEEEDEETVAWTYLRASSERMMILLDLAKDSTAGSQ